MGRSFLIAEETDGVFYTETMLKVSVGSSRLVDQGYAIGQIASLWDRELRDLVAQHRASCQAIANG